MFKDKLKDLRTKKGVSQNDLAEKIFVSRSAIAKWENGLGMPSKASMDSLCNYFQISKEELLKEEDPLIIIDNIKRKSMKTLIIILAIILPILLYCLAFRAMLQDARLNRLSPYGNLKAPRLLYQPQLWLQGQLHNRDLP